MGENSLAVAVSTILGAAIILLSMSAKLSQIIKIYQQKCGEGISVAGTTLELTSLTIFVAYNFLMKFPFVGWGDGVFLAVQTVIVAVQILYYQVSAFHALVYLLTYTVACALAMSGLVPTDVLWALQGLSIPIFIIGKLMQILTNYKNGHTGQLSAITLFILLFGSLARVFTSAIETGDAMLITTNVVASFLNAILVFQLLRYWNVTGTKSE